MARVSEKALRPRQYVFNRLPSDRISKLVGRVKKLKEQEQREAQSASIAMHAVRRNEAARHAENIIAGITKIAPETEQIGALERELEELRERKTALYKTLRTSVAKKETDEGRASAAKADGKQATPSKAGAKQGENRSAKPAPGGPSAANGVASDANSKAKDGREGGATGKKSEGRS